tara:strand:+ start:967 stop:1380 length:414 start_codon:yes stop_codon:yes gene_type:complete
METYKKLSNRHSKELHDFEGMFFAFNNDQYLEGIKKLKISEKTAHETMIPYGGGAFIFKDRVYDLKELTDRQKEERENAFKNDKFLMDALVYELLNHEYCITYDEQDALDALGLSVEEVPSHIMINATREAIKRGED